MKKNDAAIFCRPFCYCAPAPRRPQRRSPKKTRWEMNAQGVMEAWGVTPDEDGLLVQFDAYDLAVYRELAVRLENQNAA